jgi:hypothetical protein
MQLRGRIRAGPAGFMLSIRTFPKDLPPIPEGPVQCKECEQLCRVVPTTHADGRRELTDIYCENGACSLRGRDQRLIGTPHDEVRWNNDGTFTHSAEGAPDQNEENVRRVAGVFLDAGQRAGMMLADFRVTEPDSKRETGVDCELLDGVGTVVLKLQVTRAPMNDFWKAQRQGRAEQTLSPEEAAELLKMAIERKRLSAAIDVDLVIDGTHAAQLAFLSEQLLATREPEWLSAQGWRAIWVVGTSWLRPIWPLPASP